jgi:flavin reductase (DIM6/NTAB) family NADH-FMN oxidoreductase RutF
MQTAPPISQQEFRHGMGNFATGVAVITGSEAEEPLGFACQSVASVSLEPPLVLFCADHRGRSWPRIRRSGHFCVNVLAEDQSDLCTRFGSSRGRRFDELEWETSAWGCPAFRDVLLRVHADVVDVHVAGDHDVVIGEVQAIEHVRDEVRPMVFFRASFSLDPEPDPRLSVPYVWGWGDHWG